MGWVGELGRDWTDAWSTTGKNPQTTACGEPIVEVDGDQRFRRQMCDSGRTRKGHPGNTRGSLGRGSGPTLTPNPLPDLGEGISGCLLSPDGHDRGESVTSTEKDR